MTNNGFSPSLNFSLTLSFLCLGFQMCPLIHTRFVIYVEYGLITNFGEVGNYPWSNVLRFDGKYIWGYIYQTNDSVYWVSKERSVWYRFETFVSLSFDVLCTLHQKEDWIYFYLPMAFVLFCFLVQWGFITESFYRDYVWTFNFFY